MLLFSNDFYYHPFLRIFYDWRKVFQWFTYKRMDNSMLLKKWKVSKTKSPHLQWLTLDNRVIKKIKLYFFLFLFMHEKFSITLFCIEYVNHLQKFRNFELFKIVDRKFGLANKFKHFAILLSRGMNCYLNWIIKNQS